MEFLLREILDELRRIRAELKQYNDCNVKITATGFTEIKDTTAVDQTRRYHTWIVNNKNLYECIYCKMLVESIHSERRLDSSFVGLCK